MSSLVAGDEVEFIGTGGERWLYEKYQITGFGRVECIQDADVVVSFNRIDGGKLTLLLRIVELAPRSGQVR
ncbi:MAG: hypothetical protein ACLPYS_15700 [Vulcanimicrobiaceae bacterium]